MEDTQREMIAAALVVMELAAEEPSNKTRGKTREWLKRWEEKGMFSALITELSVEDTIAYKDMMRMSHEDFLKILGYIEKDITPAQIDGGNIVINPKARLAITLRFLATGETVRSSVFSVSCFKACNILHCKECMLGYNQENGSRIS